MSETIDKQKLLNWIEQEILYWLEETPSHAIIALKDLKAEIISGNLNSEAS